MMAAALSIALLLVRLPMGSADEENDASFDVRSLLDEAEERLLRKEAQRSPSWRPGKAKKTTPE